LHPPVGLTAYTGRDVTLHGDAAGAAPLSYQWLLNGTNVPGATSTSLVLSNVQFSNAGGYQLSVTNALGSALSLSAPLTVISNNTLTFLSQMPAGQTNYQGSKVSLAGVTVLGSGPLHYQWFFSPTNNPQTHQIFTAIAGATNENLVFDPALASQSGYYQVVVSNQFSSVTSSSTFLRVLFAKAWGYLATDPPFNVTNAVAIAVGNAGQSSLLGHYLVLKSDGKISSWSGGFVSFGETNVAALSNSTVTAIAAGYQDSLALKSDGTVYAWGYNIYGETNVPSGLNGVTAIACGDYHNLALKSDGTVAGWGQNTYFQTTNAAATNVVAIAAGGLNSMALRANGSVITWGSYGGGQSSVPSTATNVIAIAVGGQHYLALRANGTVVGWGNNTYGQSADLTGISNIVAISAGANHSVLLRNDGTVLKFGAYNGSTLITPPADLANVIAIASGGDHDLALFGTRAPSFTVQPWNRTIASNARTNIILAAKCAGVQPMRYQWQLNGTNLPSATNDTLILTNQPSLQFGPVHFIPTGAYQLIASNAYGVVASKYAKVTTFYPLGDALDTPTDGKGNYLYNWTTSGNAPWFGETNVTHDGVDAAQSGGIGPLQETVLQTIVGTNWSGRYTFWWKVSSEQDFDFLEFRVNGILQTSISGEVNWQQASIPVAAGTNVLQWRYSKDVSYDGGQDAGWVDQFAFIPDGPTITLQPVSQTVNMGTNVTFFVTATGPPFSQNIFRYQWRQNGNLVGGNSPLLILNNVGRAQNGTYSVTVSNIILSGGSTVSSNAVLKVLVPQLLGSPKLLPDGSFQLTSTDANGGLLRPSDLANFEAQASTNLVNWTTLPNALSLTNGLLQLQDSGQSNFTARYYRLIEH
jgi:alpha-tubulin suppressor-like RCC1 family protein